MSHIQDCGEETEKAVRFRQTYSPPGIGFPGATGKDFIRRMKEVVSVMMMIDIFNDTSPNGISFLIHHI